jgi:hypothetical protein
MTPGSSSHRAGGNELVAHIGHAGSVPGVVTGCTLGYPSGHLTAEDETFCFTSTLST